jgi:hypothetical protein
MRHPMEARLGKCVHDAPGISVSDDRNSLKIGARGRTSAETFRVGAKGKDRASQGLFQDGGSGLRA